ncbi:MAG: hypothetical protein M9936_17925 [Caldilinea sp.]|nr:hypothetical protein [Caldilinea sp.]MCB0069338.1 hypothetical protein [Caldilineaceae bacterium]MCO5211574.1 hypothetical protein [Caldilinea sp.]
MQSQHTDLWAGIVVDMGANDNPVGLIAWSPSTTTVSIRWRRDQAAAATLRTAGT